MTGTEYATLDRRTRIVYPSETQYFEYDANGNLTRTIDAWGTANLSCDKLSRVVLRSTPRSDKVYYQYDEVSNLARMKWYSPGSMSQVYYIYDAANRMTQVNSATILNTYYQYNASSNVSKKRLPNSGVAAYYSYDMADRLSSLRYLKSGGGVAYFDYTRDAAARITKIRREGSLGIYYQYDALDRLTDETWLRGGTQIYAFSYDYDLSHNRTRMRREHAAGVEWDSSYYVYDVSDALTKRQVLPANVTTYYHYDLNGALVKQFDSNATYFQYGANQLVTQVAPTGVSPWNFGYDAGLNRYTIDKGGTVSYYLWDGLNLLEERDSSGNLIARYSYGYSSIYGIGSCVEIYQQASEHKYTLVMDHRGTAYVLLDETGTEIGRRWYDAFGVLLGSTRAWPVDLGYHTNWLSFKIGGMDVGLSKYRIYVPALGIFVSRDFLAEYINKYRAFSNNPVGQVDRDGLADAAPSRGDLANWIRQLNDDDYQTREAAKTALLMSVDSWDGEILLYIRDTLGSSSFPQKLDTHWEKYIIQFLRLHSTSAVTTKKQFLS